MTRAEINRSDHGSRESKRKSHFETVRRDAKSGAFKSVGDFKSIGYLWEQRRPVLDALALVPGPAVSKLDDKYGFSSSRTKGITMMQADENLLSRAMRHSLASLERSASLIEESVSESRLTGAEITAGQRRIARNLASIDRALGRLIEAS
jgi:hypothetical protein